MWRALAAAAAVGLLAQPPSSDAARQFDALYRDVRDRRIDREAARSRVQALIPKIAADFYARGGVDAPKSAWRFPLRDYGAESIGGRRGSGYIVDGYDWFDGSLSRGHPGHDIFIRDRNQDELDDRTGTPVDVLSISSGIVVAYSPDWKPGSLLRGGRYVYVYDPSAKGMFYYAHQRTVIAKPGDIVVPGQPIGTVGRSGRNAAAPRSPTHLHVMFLAVDASGRPAPRDLYADLIRIAGQKPAF
jgi:murein DD-endopeptidase MepM/ murein hydrolase activator NlpD